MTSRSTKQGKDAWYNAVHHPTDTIIDVYTLSEPLRMMDGSEIIGDYWYQTWVRVHANEVRGGDFCRTYGRLPREEGT